MGILTQFVLLEAEHAKATSAVLEWLVYAKKAPPSVPNGYRVRRCGIDKSWDDWDSVFEECGLDGAAERLEAAFQVEVLSQDHYTRFLSAPELAELKNQLATWDKQRALEVCERERTTGYNNEALCDDDRLTYVVHYIDVFVTWLNTEHRDDDALFIDAV